MSHLTAEALAGFATTRRLRNVDVRHLDGCVACRHAAAEHGLADGQIAGAGAARAKPHRLIGALALAALVGISATAVPLRGAASNFFAIFEPHHVAAVPLTLAEMRSLSSIPDLAAYASTRQVRTSTAFLTSDARAAATAAGFGVRRPASTPAELQAVSYLVQSPSAELVSFDKRLPITNATSASPPLPDDIYGSTLEIDLGATVIASYTTTATAADERRLARLLARPVTSTVRLGTPARSAHAMRIGWSTSRGLPLVVVQMPAPRVASTKASVARLASFMLDQPGVPPRVVAAFRALGDLSTTLPIPIPIDRAYTQPVFVDGVVGVGIGDDTGIGAAVVWQKNGMLYGVFATRAARDVLSIANSLR